MLGFSHTHGDGGLTVDRLAPMWAKRSTRRSVSARRRRHAARRRRAKSEYEDGSRCLGDSMHSEHSTATVTVTVTVIVTHAHTTALTTVGTLK